MPLYLLLQIESEEDRRQLGKLYEQYKKYLFSIALDISKDTEIAEEALSETFVVIVDLYEKIKGYEEDHMKYFLRTVLKNKTIDLIHEKNKVANNTTALNEKIIGSTNVDLDEFEQSSLVLAMSTIQDEFREILIMKYVSELSTIDIASALNINYETAKKRIVRARAALRKKLEEMENE